MASRVFTAVFSVLSCVLSLCSFQALGARSAADGRDGLRLAVPYPITGPREIQASDRATRRYRTIAAYAVPPVSEAMSELIAHAVLIGEGAHVMRVRHAELDQFDASEPAGGGQQRFRQADLLFAGDEIIRGFDQRRRAARTGREAQLRLVDSIAVMPFVLICARARCAAGVDSPARAIAQGEPRFIGTSGELSTSYLAARMLLARLHRRSVLVPYAGGSSVFAALVGQQIDLAFVALPLALGHIGESKTQALGIASANRFSRLPALPTLVESGLPGFVVEGWFALFASSRLADEHVARLSALVRTYRLEPASRLELIARGLLPGDASVREFGVRLAVDRARWAADHREW